MRRAPTHSTARSQVHFTTPSLRIPLTLPDMPAKEYLRAMAEVNNDGAALVFLDASAVVATRARFALAGLVPADVLPLADDDEVAGDDGLHEVLSDVAGDEAAEDGAAGGDPAHAAHSGGSSSPSSGGSSSSSTSDDGSEAASVAGDHGPISRGPPSLTACRCRSRGTVTVQTKVSAHGAETQSTAWLAAASSARRCWPWRTSYRVPLTCPCAAGRRGLTCRSRSTGDTARRGGTCKSTLTPTAIDK